MSIGQVRGSNMGLVYILQSLVNQRYYIGSTNDLRRRFKEHNDGRSSYTKSTRPFRLVFSQKYSTLGEARRIEYKLKKFKNRSIIERIIEDKHIRIKDT